MMDSNHESKMLSEVQKYRKLVLLYEALRTQIGDLIHASDGSMENMPEEDRERYRDLAQKRDEIFNEMLILGQALSVDGPID